MPQPQTRVWSLWSDLDNGGFNFPRTMMNTPLAGPFGGSGQLSSGVGVNASIGYGNYNARLCHVQDVRLARPDHAVELHLVARRWEPER